MGNINWTNCWRFAFICLLLAAFFEGMKYSFISEAFGIVGGVSFIILIVIRFEDFKEFMDRR